MFKMHTTTLIVLWFMIPKSHKVVNMDTTTMYDLMSIFSQLYYYLFIITWETSSPCCWLSMNFLSDGPSSALLLKPAHYVIGKSSEKELFISLFSKFCVTFIFITPLKSLVLKRPRLSSLLTLLLAIRFISKGGIGRLIWIFQGELIIGHVLKLVHTKDSTKIVSWYTFHFFRSN